MNNNRSKLVIHGAGGCGISLGGSIYADLNRLEDGFCNTTINFLDTSANSVHEGNKDVPLFRINNTDAGGNAIKGGGGERQTNASHIPSEVNRYLNENKFTKYNGDEFHLVVFSAGGGSGSVIGPVLVKQLLSTGIPVIAMIAGSNDSAIIAKHTKNTLAGLDSVARKLNKPLSIMYSNNSAFSTGSPTLDAVEANKAFRKNIKLLSVMLSGTHNELDYKDMVNFVDQSHYGTVNVIPGLYGISMFDKEVKLPDNAVHSGIRSLTPKDIPVNSVLSTLHSKIGYVAFEETINEFKDINWPIHAVTHTNWYGSEVAHLDKEIVKAEEAMKAMQNSIITGSSEASEDGLVL